MLEARRQWSPRGAGLCLAGLCLAGLVAAGAARAEPGTDASAPSNDTSAPPQAAGKLEFNFFPLVGGNSDVGFGGGQISNVARLGTGEGKYRWKIEDAAFITFKWRDDKLVIPFVDVYARWTVPSFGPEGRFRIEVRPSYTDERTLGYFGIGNASRYPEGVPVQTLEYRRTHPTLAARLRGQVIGGWHAVIGTNFTWSRLQVRGDTLLERERTQGSPAVQRLLGSFTSHGVQLFEAGAEYDTRDQETVPHHGQYHMLLARYSPALGGDVPYHYLQLEAIARFYTTPVPRWLTLSFRLVGDAFLGDPPFYELARYGDTPAIGGGKAVRGVPAQRYHGKVKLFGNAEARSEVLPFTIRKKAFVLAVAGFVDAGRTWTELTSAHPELDGRGLGIKYGVGGGLRLQQGKTFVVRADLAWSPDARPIGGYFEAGQIF